MTEKRTEEFQRNSELERLLFSLNADLQASEQRLLNRYRDKTMTFPLILVMGPLRSGTTLFTQWLANTGLFAYPTNLLSRFYQAPILGAKIQLLLTDPRYNFRDELGEFAQKVGYESENGKTKGILAPNEFWYFWRRFLAEPGCDVWTDDELRNGFDAQTMRAELAGIMDILQKPFAAKGMLFNYNIPFLDSILDNVLFAYITRDPVANVASVLEARKRQLGSENHWYSFKIPEYEQLKDQDPITQAAGQLHSINEAVRRGLSQVDEARKLVVAYEDFCVDPHRFFCQLNDKMGWSGNMYAGPTSFSITKPNRAMDHKAIKAALQRFS